ncbi:hypothetical protein F6V30_04830 [Oryzomonas sagensis]|uniref:GNAT family N-acetyltransferase n=1 Tax=Oryzomonas sagensis TaxID=2603857 RepID=A0ABQ6TS96_9BACT|nr:hypothetical protein [Oryzomonas sagensis]KAB0671908.1 hypothetical protein F6V30_04830 [Oryzomonas sagensis]
MTSRLHLETFGPVHALPILHYRMEFAHLVRQTVQEIRPDCIAVELPATLEERFLQAVRRLPQVSVVSYDTIPRSASTAAQNRTLHLLVEPADPLAEAARCALEQAIPLHLVDVDLDDYPAVQEFLPDSYAVQRLGLADYYREYCRATEGAVPGREDLRREQGMAFRLQRLAERHERILFVGGMAHVGRIREFYGQARTEPLGRVRRHDVRIFNLHPDSCGEVMGEFPFASAIYEMRRNGPPPERKDAAPSLRRRFNALELIAGGKQAIPEQEVMRAAVESSAGKVGASGEMPDRQRIHLRLFEQAARHYRQETGEQLHYWQKRAFFRFCRNYAALSGQLLPDLFQLLTAARGCVDDNFAYAFWRLAGCYPWQREEAEIPVVRLRVEDLWDQSRTIRFRPRKQSDKGRSGLRFLKRKREQRPGEWLEGFDDGSICSWPPEDIVIEDYGKFLRRTGIRQLSEEQSRVEPLSTSLLDGIDLRETIRNQPHDGRIYVWERMRIKGGVGSVVVIFDEDRRNRYPFAMTWLGEHEQESDMAFYATEPGDNVSGPGICRCEYGGLLLSYPPRRMRDVWQDPSYRGWGTKAEILLMAALDYSPDPHVVYAAARPPRSIFKRIAAGMGKKIVYIPLGSLSPPALKRIRVMHLLFGHDKREIAKDYIW